MSVIQVALALRKKHFLPREVLNSCTKSSNCHLYKYKSSPASFTRSKWNLLFLLSNMLLHKNSQQTSKIQNTVINYFVCDAKFDLHEGCSMCIVNNDGQNGQNLSPYCAKSSLNHNAFLFPCFWTLISLV